MDDGPGPSSGWFEGRGRRLAVPVYYEDTDFIGVVYHANYVRYFERGQSDFLRLAGISHGALLERPDPRAFVITRLAMDFRRAARIDDALLVHTTWDAIKGPRMTISQTITRGAEVIATADVQAACITLEGRPCRPPPELTASLGPYLLGAHEA